MSAVVVELFAVAFASESVIDGPTTSVRPSEGCAAELGAIDEDASEAMSSDIESFKLDIPRMKKEAAIRHPKENMTGYMTAQLCVATNAVTDRALSDLDGSLAEW